MTDQPARPLRTADEIRACGHTPTQHRADDGHAADTRSQDQAVRQLTAERDQARATIAAVEREHGEDLEQLTQAWAALNRAGLAGPGSVAQHIAQLAEQRDVARHLVDVRTAALSRRTRDLTAAVRERDILTDAIGRMISLPPDAVANAYNVRYGPAERPDSAGEGTDKGDAATEAHAGAEGFEGALAPWIRRAVSDPGSIAGRRRGPTWTEGEEGWAEQQETVAAWTTRAVLRVIAHGGRPVCERCDEVIAVDDVYEAPLPGVGLWEHHGDCPTRDAAPNHAQPIRPADWEQRAIDAARDALAAAWPNLGAGAVAEVAVRAIIDAGLAGPGGRCPACGQTYPRTIPAGEDQRCWTCSSEPDPAAVAEHRPAVAKVLADVRAGRSATLAQIARDTALLDAALRAGDVDDEMTPAPAYPATTPTLGEYHWGRAWSPTQDEATCPCPKAGCGYVVRTAERTGCEYHGPTTTMRGGHPAGQCPAKEG